MTRIERTSLFVDDAALFGDLSRILLPISGFRHSYGSRGLLHCRRNYVQLPWTAWTHVASISSDVAKNQTRLSLLRVDCYLPTWAEC